MPILRSVPDWMGGPLIGALIAALGYVAKLFFDTAFELRKQRRHRQAQLVQLKSLLDASRVSFQVQNEHAVQLLEMLRKSNPSLETAQGYDESFANAYSSFSPQEGELHSIIRGLTIYALKPTNNALLAWIQNDDYFRGEKNGKLQASLAQLQAHLLLWLAKYEIWIPDKPQHALVYMVDEQRHGIEFPWTIDKLVSSILKGR